MVGCSIVDSSSDEGEEEEKKHSILASEITRRVPAALRVTRAGNIRQPSAGKAGLANSAKQNISHCKNKHLPTYIDEPTWLSRLQSREIKPELPAEATGFSGAPRPRTLLEAINNAAGNKLAGMRNFFHGDSGGLCHFMAIAMLRTALANRARSINR
jgi:hypothetical protein